MSEVPDSLVVVNGAMTMDGGSILLRCLAASSTIDVALDWSIGSRSRGCPQLSVGDRPIPRGSNEESEWLALIEQAEILTETPPVEGDRISPKRIVLSDDIGDYFTAIERGPTDALRYLVMQLIALVRSTAYQSPSSRPRGRR